jgi:hypothetical protein
MTYIPGRSAIGRKFINTDTTLTSDDPPIIAFGLRSFTLTITLPLANSVPGGFTYYFKDEDAPGMYTGITIQAQGSDTIQGGSYTFTTNLETYRVYSNGTDKWFIV